MKKGYRRLKVEFDGAVNAAPAKIQGIVFQFCYDNNDIDAVYIQKYSGHWDGSEYKGAILYIKSDLKNKFIQEHPELF